MNTGVSFDNKKALYCKIGNQGRWLNSVSGLI